MGGSQYIPSFSLSSFAQAVSSPYTSLNAYRSGAIDERGNLLKPESSIDDFEYFIIKLKKIFDQVPMSYTRSALDSYATTFKMFTEDAEKHGMKPHEFMFFVEGYLTTLLTEDMTTGTTPGTLGTPAQATSEGGVMGYEKVLGAPPAPFMGGIHMFDVSKEDLENFKTHKAWKHIPDSETKKYLQRFQRRNKDSKIAIRALNPENGKHEVHWVKMKPISFMEEFNIYDLGILFEEEGVVQAFTDKPSDPEDNQATLPNSKEKAKRNRKGFVRPKPNPATSHADRFREDINELVKLYGEATSQKREAHAHEYGARIAFHAHNYHNLKDTPHIAEYMDKTHQQIISSASANDRGLKSGDVLRAKKTDLGVEYETMDFKSKGANVAAGFPVAFLKDMLARNPENLASWTRTTSGSKQSFVFPKIKVGGVENPEHAKSARERFESMRSAIEGIQDPNLMQQREAIKKKTEGKSTRTMVIRHPETGRFHFVTPKQVVPYISQKGGQADRAFREGHQRHNIIYRRDFSNPPKDSEVFEMEQGAQDTLLSHADPAHHELLKKLTDIHIKKS